MKSTNKNCRKFIKKTRGENSVEHNLITISPFSLSPLFTFQLIRFRNIEWIVSLLRTVLLLFFGRSLSSLSKGPTPGQLIHWRVVFFDLRKSGILHFLPTPNPLYYTSDLLARGFTAVIWTCGRSARPLACPSRTARPRNCLNLT